MKKYILILLVLLGITRAYSQEFIGTMTINLKDTTVHCYFMTALDTNIHTSEKYVGKYIKSNLLQNQLNNVIGDVINEYPTCISFNYQNASFFDGNEHVWIALKDGTQISIYIKDIGSNIQGSVNLLGLKTIGIIQGGDYEN